MQIAAWQALSTHGDIATNLARLDESARRAAAEGAALLIRSAARRGGEECRSR